MRLRHSLFYSFFEKYSSFIVQFAANVTIARLLTPEDIGIYSVGIAVFAFAHAVRDFGVTNYLIQEQDLTNDRIRSALTVTAGIAWSLAIIIAVASPFIASFYNEPGLAEVLIVLAVGFALLPLGSTIMAVLRREMRFRALYVVNTSAAFVNAGVSVLLASLGVGFMSLAWGSLAGIIVTAATAILFHRERAHFLPGFREVRRVLRFGATMSAASLLNEAGTAAVDLTIGRILGFAAVGNYSRAQGLIQAFRQLVLQGLSPVLLPALAAMRRGGRELAEPCVTAMNHLAAVTVPFFAFFAVMAEPTIMVLFGDQWGSAVPVLRILAIGWLFAFLGPVAVPAFVAMGRPQLALRLQAITQPVKIAAVIPACMISLNAVAIVIASFSILQAGLSYIYLRRLVGIDFHHLYRIISVSSGIATIALCLPLTVLLIGPMAGFDEAIELILASIGAGIGWLLGIFVFRHPLVSEVRQALTKIRSYGESRLRIGPSAPGGRGTAAPGERDGD